MAERTPGTRARPGTTGPGAAYADARERYRLDERIATGGMGEVWRATDTVLDREVAVKLLKPEHADDAVFRSRFATEAQHAAGLHHPGIAQVYDYGTGDTVDGGHRPYLVMEYVVGQPLSALLRPGQPMAPAAAADLLAGAGDALGAAHAQGIVHRDVKPANLLVTDDRRVKITDFGIARAADAVALTRTGEVLGTPQYLSPEQAEGRPATPASDVYSLGAVAYECLAGRRPFVADTPVATALAHLREPVPALPPTVPSALAAVVHRALAKDPADRYADGSAFAAAVREAGAQPAPVDPATTRVMTAPVAAAAGLGAGAAPVAVAGTTEPAWRQRARAVPAPVWAAAGAFVLVLAIAALAAATTSGSPGPASQRSPHTPATHATAAATPASGPSSPVSSSESSSAQTGPPPKHPKPGPPGKAKGHEHGKGHQ